MVYLIVFVFKILSIPFPNVVVKAASVISGANMPLSLLLLGLYLSFTFDRRYLSRLIKYLVTRYGASLFIGILIYFFLPVSEMIMMTLLIGLCLPIPLSVIPYAEEFKYDHKFVVMVSNVTILTSFVLIWLMIIYYFNKTKNNVEKNHFIVQKKVYYMLWLSYKPK